MQPGKIFFIDNRIYSDSKSRCKDCERSGGGKRNFTSQIYFSALFTAFPSLLRRRLQLYRSDDIINLIILLQIKAGKMKKSGPKDRR